MTDSRAKGAQFERFCVNYIKDNLGEHLPEMPKRNLSQYQEKQKQKEQKDESRVRLTL